jgi:fructokinase
MQNYYLGVDVGGTKTEISLIRLKDSNVFESYEVLGTRRMPTDKALGLGSYLERMKNLVDDLLGSSGIEIKSIQGIGMGLPGSIDPRTQIMAQGSIPFFKGISLQKTFQERLGYSGPIHFDNDANCFALAEAYLGAGAAWAKANGVPLEHLCMLGVTLGTGVGGGMIVNGELIRGRRGGAGEIGHATLIESGRPCYCGKMGCAEQYLSGPAFEHSYHSRTAALEALSAKEIFKHVDEGNPFALSTLDSYRDLLITFLSNLSNILDPHVIVLGGGMSVQRRLYPGIEDRLKDGCFLTENPPAVLPHQIGDSAGVIGAALLSFDKITPHKGGSV